MLAFSCGIEKTVFMRGAPDPQMAMLTTVSTEDLIPADHPIRKIRVVVDAVLAELDPVFDRMYAAGGRASGPPEALLKSTVLLAMYSIRSERAFCERLNYTLLFKGFLDTRIDHHHHDDDAGQGLRAVGRILFPCDRSSATAQASTPQPLARPPGAQLPRQERTSK